MVADQLDGGLPSSVRVFHQSLPREFHELPSPPPSGEAFAQSMALAVADVTNDARLDVLLGAFDAGTQQQRVYVFENQSAALGAPSLAAPRLLLAVSGVSSVPICCQPTAIDTCDADGDGRTDVALSFTQRSVLARQVARLRFTAALPGSAALGAAAHGGARDLDGDGDVDYFTSAPSVGLSFGSP